MPAQAWSRIPRALALVLSAAVATLSAGLLGTPSQAAAAFSCTGNPNHPVSTSKALGISGLYTVPEQTPTGLAVFGHGYRNNSLAWAGKAPTSPSGPGHLEEAAQKGLIAVAPDYSGLGPAPDYRGWPAAAGAGDLVKAAQFLVSACPSINQVVLLGVSMGGNMTGLAMAADAKRPGSHRPLFDYWIDVEGVTNWIETYAEATAAGRGGNAYAAGAQQDIEKECGGPLGPTTAPCYQNRDVVARSVDVANSGVKGVAMVHAVLDGLVPSDQSREMSTTLRGLGIPTDQFNVMRRNTNEGQTTLLTDASQSQLDATLQPAGHG